MSILPPSAEKHDFEGVGSSSAAVIMAALAANASTSFITTGLVGKIAFYILKKVFSALASMGLVLLNVGAEKLLVTIDKVKYDGSMRSAYELIEQIRKTGRDLTPEEIKEIDDKVIFQFRKFAKMTRRKNETGSGETS